MTNTTIHQCVTMESIACECGGVYALPARYIEEMRRLARSWHCPYCQIGWGFWGQETELEKAKKELARERAKLDQADAALIDERKRHATTEARRRAEMAAKTKIKNRISNGVCPCCKRTFRNLARHIHGQHPEWSGNE